MVTVAVTLALYVSLGRYYIKYVDDYQQLLLEKIGAVSGLSLKVDNLQGHWSKLSPVFSLDNVQLLAPDGSTPVLRADKVEVQLDVLGTLFYRSVHIRRLLLDGMNCALQEVSPGKWQLRDFPLKDAGGNPDAIVDLILSVDKVELADANLSLSFVDGDAAELAVRELSLHRDEDFRRLRLQATVDDSDRPLLAIVEATGDPREFEDFEANAYVKLDALDLSDQLPAMRVLGIELQQAVVDGELWLEWHPGTEIIAQGRLNTPFLDVAALSGETLQPMKDVNLSFRLEKTTDHQWKLWIPSFSTQWQGQQLVFEQMVLEAAGESAALALPLLSVDQTVKHLLALNLLAEPEQQLIETLSPQGLLRNIHVQLTGPDEQHPTPRFAIRANLDDVSIAAWHGAPGGRGISGYFEAKPLMGLVEVDAQDMALDFPHVYHHSLEFDRLQGQVRWWLSDTSVIVKSGPLNLQTVFGSGTGQLALDIPLHKDEGTPTMNLSVGLRDTDAHYRDLLLPYTLDPHLLEWLAHSIPSGTVKEGGFIYRGSLLHSDHLNRTVQLFLDVEDTALDFHSDWPPLSGIDGMLVIDNGLVNVRTDRASMYSLGIRSSAVTVETSEQGLWVKVKAEADGQAGGVLDIVNNSMINDLVGGAFRSWSLDGNARARIELDLPPAESQQEQKIDVAVTLSDGQLKIPEQHLELNALAGKVIYNNRTGLSAERLNATLMDKPMRATITQSGDEVAVDISGRVAMSDVAEWSAQPALAFTSGETDYSARVLIAGYSGQQAAGPGRSVFTVNSTLKGVAIDLPAPLGKSAEQEQAFSLRQPLSGDNSLLTMRLGKVAELEMKFERKHLASALLAIGGVAKKQHLPGMFLLKGGVARLDYDEWEPVVKRYLEQQEKMQGAVNAQSPTIEFAASDFQVGTLDIFSTSYTNNTVDARQRSDGWWLSLVNQSLDGELFLPTDSDQPMSILLDRLTIAEPDPGAADADLLASVSLQDLKPFDAYIAIANLTMGSEAYGSLAFELQTEPGRLTLKNLGGHIRDMRIGVDEPALMEWFERGGKVTSGFYGDVDFDDLGEVLKQWNYEQFIESEYGKASFALSWPGRPDEFELKSSTGSLSLDLRKGRFLKASNTASGTLKVVGIVNLMNVVRRLRMDFSDVFSKGISYDRVSGAAAVADKKLSITDALEVKSPSSRFNLRGVADLDNALLDMELVATLPVASNLPWVAALAGGLPVAAGVYLASKIFEDQVDRFSSAVYTVKGDWNDPEMKFKRVFDNTKPANGP